MNGSFDSSDNVKADIKIDSDGAEYIWNITDNKIVWSGNWQKIFGYQCKSPPATAQELASFIPAADQDIIFGEERPSFTRQYRILQSDGATVTVKENGYSKKKSYNSLEQCGTLVLLPKDQIDLHKIIAKDMSEQSTAHTAHHIDTEYDNGNERVVMIDNIKRHLSYSMHKDAVYMVVKIERFSIINEAFGSKATDALLKSIVNRLREVAPRNSIIARISHDCLGILMLGNREIADYTAARMLRSFRERSFALPATSIHVCILIGATSLKNNVSTKQLTTTDIMIRAEQALFAANKKGHIAYSFWYEDPSHVTKERRDRLELGEKVRCALQENRVRLAYQPIIDAESGRVVFYEALARLINEDGSVIPAAKFIPIVEEQGLFIEFDKHILNIAVSTLAIDKDVMLAINVSGYTASDPLWPEYVQEVLSKSPDVASRLIIEITESANVVALEEMQKFAATMRQHGSQVALDDFGAGFTSLQHLNTLPLNLIKIDRSLLSNLIGNDGRENMVRMLIKIAHGLGQRVIAEGVETENVAKWLRNEKVDMMQGYYFGYPSLDKPWINLKGAEADADRISEIMGSITAGSQNNQHNQLHAAAIGIASIRKS